MPRIELRAATLHVHDEGAGEVLLMLHGFPLDHTMWRHQIAKFRNQFRVIAPDLRGFGASTIESISAKTGIEMVDYAEDVRQVLDQMEISRPVILAGFSMGGYVALQFLAQYADRVRAVVMVDTRAVGDTPATQVSRFNMAENVEGWGAGHVAGLMLPKLVSPKTAESHPEVVAEVEAMISRTSPVAIAAAQRGMAHRPDMTPLLGRLQMPTLCLVGSADEITPPEAMQDMADAMPNASVTVIEGAGHMSPMENPTQFNKALGQFLDGLTQ